MSRLWWTAVAVFLTAQSIDAVDKKKLSEVVGQVLNLYKPTYYKRSDGKLARPMFSLALSIPYNEQKKQYDLDAVTNLDNPDKVKETMVKCQVYTGRRVVGATVLGPSNIKEQCPEKDIEHLLNTYEGITEHAEYRVLQHFHTLVSKKNSVNRETDLMLFYVLKNPCIEKCMNPNTKYNIIDDLTQIHKWKHFAFVFTDVFVPYDSDPNSPLIKQDIHNSVKTLGHTVCLTNVYRCGGQECFRCYDEDGTDEINEKCVRVTAQ